MSLVQDYRSQLIARQNSQLAVYLLTATALHLIALAVGLVGLPMFHAVRSTLKPPEKADPVAVSFVYLDPAQASTAKPPETPLRAAINSVSGGTQQPQLPVSPGQSSKAPQSIAALPQSAAPARPAPQTPIAPPPRPVHPALLPRQNPSPIAVNRSAPAHAAAANPPATVAPQAAPPQPAVPTIPAQNSAAAQLGRPATGLQRQAGQGLDALFNPDRTAAGNPGINAQKDDVFGAYIAELNRRVDRHWQRISIRTTRQAKVRFTIDRQGQLTSLELMQSSGEQAADEAALSAVQSAAPFAPLPRNAREDLLVVNFTFTYYVANAPALGVDAASQQ